jgi:glycosyltransferase involved in cell wall biosynthesis
MKILLLQTLDYLYCMGGAHKANRILMEALASKGCECKVVFPLYIGEEYYYETLNKNGVDVATTEETQCAFFFELKGVEVSVAKGKFHLYSVFLEEVDKFAPDIILVTEDHTGLLLEIAFETSCRVVYISHTQATLPFGPSFFGNNERMLSLFEKLNGIISVSNFVKNYILEWSNLKSEVIYFPSYSSGPYELLGSYDNEFITIINPSGIKGIDVFFEMAKRLTNVSFAAVPTWSTKVEDIDRLKQLNNITILEPDDDIDNIYKRTRILLVPSLWHESFGQVVVEAMLRGIPVIASDIGGLPEAIQGCDYIIPVNPIQ